jgi:isopentenyl-diphosphate delta-isomerase
MGFDCDLLECFSLVYRAELDNGMVEHEFDHVLTGHFAGDPRPDPAEVSEFQWVSLMRLQDMVASRPNAYTYWLRIALHRMQSKYQLPAGDRFSCVIAKQGREAKC